MSFKQYVPDTSEDWDTYWRQTSIQKELDLIKSDGLGPVFKKYLKKNGLNIEAGCGLGKWVIGLKNQGYNIIGLDTYVKGLQTLKKFDSKLLLQAADVAELSLKDNSIDAYISLGVVEHFEQGPQKPLQEAYRVTKKNGIALIEVPFDSPLRQLTRTLYRIKVLLKMPVRVVVETLGLRKPRPPIKKIFYEYRYTKSELETFVKQAGFKVITTLPKDDNASNRSIMLWSDYPWMRHTDGTLFKLNSTGILIKKILDSVSPFTYSALIVAVCKK